MRNVNSNFYPCDDRKKGRQTWRLFQPRNPSKVPPKKNISPFFFFFVAVALLSEQRRHFRRERGRETTALFYPRCLCGEPKRKSVRVEIFVVSFAMRANIMRDITFTALKIYESSCEISDEQKRLERRGVCFSPLLSPGASGVGFQVDALFFSVSFVERVRSRFGFIFRSPSV